MSQLGHQDARAQNVGEPSPARPPKPSRDRQAAACRTAILAALASLALALGAVTWSPPRVAAQPVDCRLDVDGNGHVDALTDGILIVRYLFGFSGPALVEGAVGAGATRPTPYAVAEFLGAAPCAGMLDADGSGAADALTDGMLILRYLFGFADAALVEGVVAPAATRRDAPIVAAWLTPFQEIGPDLELYAPLGLTPLIPDVKASLRLRAAYRGELALRFALLEGPAGMTIDVVDGTLQWTPPKDAEGQQRAVRAQCTDGTLSAEVSFSLVVAATRPMATAVVGSTLTITEAGSLQGLAVTLPAQATATASELAVMGVSAEQAPPVPTEILRVSDFFRVSPAAATGDDDIVVDLPAGGLPAGRSREELRLYAYVEQAIGVPGPFWMQVRHGLDLLPDGKVRVTTSRLGHVSFVGVPQQAAGAGRVAIVGQAATARATQSITCDRQRFSDGTLAYFQHVCTVTGDEGFVVTIRDVESDRLWRPLPQPADVADWLHRARLTFRPWAMSAAPAFEVFFEKMPADDPALTGAGGYCDGKGDLHILNELSSIDVYRNAIVHEYFHHAQLKTDVAQADFWHLYNNYPRTAWFYEGTAKWFEDEVFDDLNSYRWGVAQPFPHILEVGLASPQPPTSIEPSSPAFPYSRFAFFKWLRSRCGVLNFNYLLNPAMAYEATGLENLAAWIRDRGCNFGQGFGSANTSSFASALLGYASATTWMRDLSLLDSDEDPQGFEFASIAEIEPSPDCALDGNCPTSAYRHFTLPPGGARSIVIHRRDMPASSKAILRVQSDQPAWVSLWSDEDIPQVNPASLDLGVLTPNVHATWFRSDAKETYEYSAGEAAAAGLFATIVNPDASESTTVLLRGRIESTGAHLDGIVPASDLVRGDRITLVGTGFGSGTPPPGFVFWWPVAGHYWPPWTSPIISWSDTEIVTTADGGGPMNVWVRPDSSRPDITNKLTVSIGEPLAVNEVSLSHCPPGYCSIKRIQPSGGTPPYDISLTGTLPPGISFDALTGRIFGYAQSCDSASYPYSVRATDARGRSVTKAANASCQGNDRLTRELCAETPACWCSPGGCG